MSDEKIYKDEPALTHMLGYLDAKKWADALKSQPSSRHALIWELIRIQDKTYNDSDYRLENEVKELLGMEA